MIQSYSQNVAVPAASSIPFNNTFQKGCAVEQAGAASFQLNRKGLYLVHFDASAFASTAAGNISVQLFKDGVADPGGFAQASSTADTDIESLSFETHVQVPCDNTCACNVSPVIIQIRNVDVPATFIQANVVITKLC